VLVLQIRDNVSPLSVNPHHNDQGMRRVRTETTRAALSRGVEGLTTPIEGVLAAREAVSLFRNDAQLAMVTKLYDQHFGEGFVSTTVFEMDGGASLSWYLTSSEISGIESQATAPGIEDKIDAVDRWLGGSLRHRRHPTPPRAVAAE
jgi:hypothetical protein